ncbi:hypothetical protein GCM10009030_02310 [Haloarcula pellucida]|uniref:Uncharacterized protein n=1 Tax=Haloarcula pellucida TaxID=1427151 RepID=A0A830GGB5_9EURY|nr:hypothetical protein GCM10009030_02310 [Halomicroarcula pellucida]
MTLWTVAKSQKWLLSHGAPPLVKLADQARAQAAKPVNAAEDAAWSAATVGSYAAVEGSAAVLSLLRGVLSALDGLPMVFTWSTSS